MALSRLQNNVVNRMARGNPMMRGIFAGMAEDSMAAARAKTTPVQGAPWHYGQALELRFMYAKQWTPIFLERVEENKFWAPTVHFWMEGRDGWELRQLNWDPELTPIRERKVK